VSICSCVDRVMPLKAAVRVAVPAAAAELTFAVKGALVVPAVTTTEAGTAIAASELVICTLDPPAGAGPLNVTVQVAAPGTVT
jgi:hypothetical protein